MHFFIPILALCPTALLALVIPHISPRDDQTPTLPPYSLPPLPYPYDALEPIISHQIMELHHDKHHQAYVNNLNAAEAEYANAQTLKQQIALQSSIKFNGGGHINHSLFWKILAPPSSAGKGNGGVLKDGRLKDAILSTFGSLDDFIKQFNTAAAAVQGSGWGWLALDSKMKTLEITTTANQDPLLTLVPIIGIDVWEHAFYLQYFNVKADYLSAIWDVIDWDEAEKRYEDGLAA